MARTGLPLRPTLVTSVMVLILGASGTVGLSAWLSSRRVVAGLWQDLASQIAHSTTQQTLRFLEPAVPYMSLTQHLVESGRVDLADPMALLAYFRAAVQANSSFTWASYASPEGSYVAVYRSGTKQEIRATWREQKGPGPDGKPLTRMRDFTLQLDGSWQPLRDEPGSYDPRTRGWYRAASEKDGGVWVEPFLFATVKQPGFMYASRVMKGPSLLGVFAVEYEMSYLSAFLASLKIGEHGRVYVVSKSGLVVGHPAGLVTEQREGQLAIAHAAGHPDAMLAGAWAALGERGQGSQNFAFGSYLAMAEPFPAESGIDWMVVGVVPEEDFFGEARVQALTALAIAALCAFLATMVGAFFSSKVSNALRDVVDEMDRIGRFELSDKKLSTTRSVVREVNMMGEATDRMKNSLRSFGKYVPTLLVRDLMHSGEEARLGGHKQEITTLFSDIEGFTGIAETLAPEALVSALGEYFQKMSEAVQHHHGTVDKYIGDAIMAFWGAPQKLDDHALHACSAALAMRRELAALQARGTGPKFNARIGINTGVALVGNIGSPDRMNYTVMGDAVNLASRLEGLNKAYGTDIIIGEATAAQVKEHMVLRALDWVAVKGKQRASLVYALVGERGTVAEEIVRAAAAHKEALDLYRGRSFEEAARLFQELSKAFGNGDGPSRVLAERCERYVVAPPPETWDGSVVMVEK